MARILSLPHSGEMLKRGLPHPLSSKAWRLLSYLHQQSWEAEMSPLGPGGRKGLAEKIKG